MSIKVNVNSSPGSARVSTNTAPHTVSVENRGPQGPTGATGATGPTGPAGAAGSGSGITGAVDRVKDFTSTSSTGDLTLDYNAPTGFQNFSDAFGVGDYFQYDLTNDDETEWEVGSGTLTSRNTLVAYVNAFDDVGWDDTTGFSSVTGGQSDPWLGTEAFNLVENGNNSHHQLGWSGGGRPLPAITSGETWTLSIYVKPGLRTNFVVDPTASNFIDEAKAEFSLVGAGSVTSTAGGGTGVFVGAAITLDSSGFYRCSVSFQLLDTLLSPYFFCLAASGGSTTYLGTSGGTAVTVAGIQLEKGSLTDLARVPELLNRVRVWESSNSGSLVNFSATSKTVIQTAVGKQINAVNAKLFGAVGDNSTDDTAAIQAAIDYAANNGIQGVYLPAGTYKTTSPIYLDHPNNRLDPNNPSEYSFSLALVGDEAQGNDDSYGTTIKPATADYIVVFIGPGQGMYVSGISVVGPSGTYRKQLDTAGIAFGTAGGSSGASRTLIERCLAENIYAGFQTGANGKGSLGDGNTWSRCFAKSCYYGWNIPKSQNYINALNDCFANNCTISVSSAIGKHVVVRGGNFSATSAKSATFTLSAVSALTDIGAGSNSFSHEYTLQATVTSPDSDIAAGNYDIFCMNSVGHGMVPLTFVSWDAGTSKVTLKLNQWWVYQQFGKTGGFYDVIASSDLEAELQAVTTLYAADQVTIFDGGQLHVDGAHIENPSVATRLINLSGTTTVIDSSFRNLIFNYSTNVPSASTPVKYCQLSHPFIRCDNSSSTIWENWHQVNSGTDAVIVLFTNSQSGTRIFGREVNIRLQFYIEGNPASGGRLQWVERRLGAGRWQTAGPIGWIGSTAPSNSTNDDGAPYQGWFQDPNITPAKTPTQIRNRLTSPGTSSGPFSGKTFYKVVDSNPVPANSITFVRSRHEGWSYGANLSVNWSIKGQSTILYVDDFTNLFNGLNVSVNTGSNVKGTIVGLYPTFGYVQIRKWTTNDAAVMDGTKTTTYTGATLTGETFNAEILSAPITAQLTADYSLTDSASAQKVLNASTNGAVTLAVGTYHLNGQYLITNGSTSAAITSHTWATQFGGTATMGIGYTASGYTAAGNALTAVQSIYSTSSAATVFTGASTSTVENVMVRLDGVIRINTEGTVIPQIKLSSTTGGAGTVLANSYIRFTPVSLVSSGAYQGSWS